MKKLAMLLIALTLVFTTGCQKEDTSPSGPITQGGSNSSIEKDSPQVSQEKSRENLEREVYKGLRLDVYLDYPRIDDFYPEIRSETAGRRIRYREHSIVLGEMDERFAERRDIDLSTLTLDESLPEQVGLFINTMLGGGLGVNGHSVSSNVPSLFQIEKTDYVAINDFDMMRMEGVVTLPLTGGDVDEVDAPFYSYFTFVDGEPFIAIMIGHDAQELDSEKAVLDDIMSTFRRWEESDK